MARAQSRVVLKRACPNEPAVSAFEDCQRSGRDEDGKRLHERCDGLSKLDWLAPMAVTIFYSTGTGTGASPEAWMGLRLYRPLTH